jgi:energy-coupling factor transport system ATP-binding protein
MGPEVLILDEPTAGLDPATRQDLLSLVRALNESGVSIVLVSHDLEEVAEVADRICAMEQGRIQSLGTPEEVFYENPANAPATVRVATALQNSSIGRPVRYADTLAALRTLMEN